MPNMQKFIATATVTVDALAHDIWALWVDVNGWTTWDHGIEKIQLHGNFKEGNSFTLTPQGGDPLESTIVSVTQGEEFSDEAVLPFGSLRTYHRMEPIGPLVKVTHEVVAEINAQDAGFFGREIWPHLQSGLSVSLNNLVDIVGN